MHSIRAAQKHESGSTNYSSGSLVPHLSDSEAPKLHEYKSEKSLILILFEAF